MGLGISGLKQGRSMGLLSCLGFRRLSLSRDFLMSMAAITPMCLYLCRQWGRSFVKMVHNAIEYIEMQCIAEHFEMMNKAMNMSYETIADVFEQWNEEFDFLLGYR